MTANRFGGAADRNTDSKINPEGRKHSRNATEHDQKPRQPRGADAPGRIWPTRKRRRLYSREVLPPRPPVLTCGAPTPQTRRWICSGNHFANWRSQMPTKLNALRRTHGNLRATTMLWRADAKAKHMHGANSGTPTTTPRLAQRSGLNLCSSDIPVLTKERTLVMQGIY